MAPEGGYALLLVAGASPLLMGFERLSDAGPQPLAHLSQGSPSGERFTTILDDSLQLGFADHCPASHLRTAELS